MHRILKRMSAIVLAIAALYTSSCGKTSVPSPSGNIHETPGSTDTEGSADDDSNDESDMETSTINLSANGRTCKVLIEDNVAVRALVSRLSEGEVTVTLDDYGDMEKVGPLGFSLPSDNRRTSTVPGDIVLYQGNSIVIFYGQNTWSYTRIGRLADASTREQVLEILGGKGETEVTLSL